MNNYTFSFISLSAFVCLVCVMSCHIVWQKLKENVRGGSLCRKSRKNRAMLRDVNCFCQ